MSEVCERVEMDQKVLRACQTHLAVPKKWCCREAKACPEPRAKRCQGVAGAGPEGLPNALVLSPRCPGREGFSSGFKKHNLLLSAAALRMTLS